MMDSSLILFVSSLGLILGGEFVHESTTALLLGRIMQGIGIICLATFVPTVYVSIISVNVPGRDNWPIRRLLFHILAIIVLTISCVMAFSFVMWWRYICTQAWGFIPSISSIVLLAVVFLVSSVAADELDSECKVSNIKRTRLFFSANFLLVVAATGLGILAEISWVTRKNSRVAVIEAVVSICLFITALFNTHGLGGRLKHKNWSFWNPFVGGIKFLILQFFSWLLLSISVVIGIIFIISFYTVGIELFVGVTAISGTLCLLAEILMILSLDTYLDTHPIQDDSNATTSSIPTPRSILDTIKYLQMFLVVILCVNIQYIPFLSLYPIFLICGMNFADTILHWWIAAISISLYTLVYLYFKTIDAQSNVSEKSYVYVYARYGVILIVQFIPVMITISLANHSLCMSLPWAVISVFHISYTFSTYTNKPEVTGCRELTSLSPILQYIDKLMQAFFKGKVIREAELNPQSLYVFGYHPHGVLPVSLFWLRNCDDWKTLFPGVVFSTLTSSALHLVPVMRDLLQWKGGREVSRATFIRSLHEKKSVLVVPGGQAELMLSASHERTIKLSIKHHGFIKLAIQEGANLVPIFSFGENDIFDNIQMPKIQKWFLRRLGAALPFHPCQQNLAFLPIPRQEEITVVVGKPIRVRQVTVPSEKEVKDVLDEYLREVRRIFELHKNTAYAIKDRELIILDAIGQEYLIK